MRIIKKIIDSFFDFITPVETIPFTIITDEEREVKLAKLYEQMKDIPLDTSSDGCCRCSSKKRSKRSGKRKSSYDSFGTSYNSMNSD